MLSRCAEQTRSGKHSNWETGLWQKGAQHILSLKLMIRFDLEQPKCIHLHIKRLAFQNTLFMCYKLASRHTRSAHGRLIGGSISDVMADIIVLLNN